jgi:ferredoxin
MPEITFIVPAPGKRKKTLKVESGVSILEAARRAGVNIETPCNGLGTCGKCKVETAGSGRQVLACQTVIEADASYIVRDYENENKSLRILS